MSCSDYLGKIILCVSVRVPLDKINVLISRVKQIVPHDGVGLHRTKNTQPSIK